MANSSLTDYFDESIELARNGYNNIINRLRGISDAGTESDRTLISTMSALVAEVVTNFKKTFSSITGVLRGYFNTLTKPISALMTPLLAVGVTLIKMFKWMKVNAPSSRGLIDWIKDIFTKGLFIVGVAIGLVVGLIWEKIKAPISILRMVFSDITTLFTGFTARLAVFTNMFRAEGQLAAAGKMFDRILEVFKLDVVYGKIMNVFRVIDGIPKGLATLVEGFGFLLMQLGPVSSAVNKLKQFGGFILKVFSGISSFMDIFGLGGNSFMSIIGKLLPGISAGMKMASKLFIPLQILLSAFDFISGFINTKGNIGDKIMGGIQNVFKGLIEGFTKPLEWILGWFGVESAGLSNKLVKVLQPLFNIVLAPFMGIVNFVRGFMESESTSLWGKIKDGFTKAFSGLIGSFNKLINGIGSLFGMTDTGGLLNGFMGLVRFFTQFTGFLGKIFLPLQLITSAFNFISGFMSTQGNIGDKLLGGVKAVFNGLIESFTKPLEWLLGWMGVESDGLSSRMMGILSPMFDIIMTPFYALVNFINGMFSSKEEGLWGKIKDGFSKAFDGIKDGFLALIQGIGKLFSPDDLLGTIRDYVSSLTYLPDWIKKRMLSGLTPSASPASPASSNTTESVGTESKGKGWGRTGTNSSGSASLPNATRPDQVSAPPQAAGSMSLTAPPADAAVAGGMGYQPSPEATNWFNSSIELNNLLKEWLKTSIKNNSVSTGVTNNTNVNSQSGGGQLMPLVNIPTDVENLGILLMNKTWGLA